jgi:hypothetical protein
VAPLENDEIPVPVSLFELDSGPVTALFSEHPINIRIDNIITPKINPNLYIVISFDLLNTVC